MMETQVVPILLGELTYSALMVLFGVVAAFFFAATKFKSRTVAISLAVGLFVLVMLRLGAPTSRHNQNHPSATSEAVIITQPQEFLSSHKPHVSTEQMWEHLNRSKIVLDTDEAAQEGELAVVSKVEKVVPKKIELAKAKMPAQIDRPDWVDTPPKRIGNVYREVVSAGPYETIQECHVNLDAPLREVVQRRISQLASPPYPSRLERLGLGMDFVLNEICRQEWVEVSEASFGEMKHAYVLMEFDATVDKQLREVVRDYQRMFRIEEVGLIASLCLGGLALLYGVLKVDTWTRGYYSKRLFFGVPAVIIAIVMLLI